MESLSMKKTISILIFFFTLSFLFSGQVFAGVETVEYLCELGVNFYRLGRYEDALSEFKKVLILDPYNPTARKYVNKIFGPPEITAEPQEELLVPEVKIETEERAAPEIEAKPALKKEDRERAMKDALRNITEKDKGKTDAQAEKKAQAPCVLSGEYRLSLGATPHDFIWKEANADRVGVPREKNWRYLWGDQRHNTYDPKIFDRLTVDLDTKFSGPLNAFMEVTVDPWTFIGKNQVTVTSGSDAVDIKLKYWSADRRTLNETYRSQNGQVIRLKQSKVIDDKTTLSGLAIAPNNQRFGDIQPTEINRAYRPFRKLWFEYKQDGYALKVFPVSDQYEALTSDDPLRISNNHVYWEENPWLDEYEASRAFKSAGEPIKEGRWIRSLSYIAKDSSDDYPHRLTFLRGVSFKGDLGSSSLEATAAAPMSLWDNYENANSAEGALRFKSPLGDALRLGFTSTTKVGISKRSAKAVNQAEAIDAVLQLSDYTNVYAEAATSYTSVQEAKGVDTKYDGVGIKAGLSYDASKEKGDGLYKGEFCLAHMDSDFYPALSNYRYTRRDEPTFSRHIYFSPIKDEDRALIWGDGVDRGRNAVGFRLDGRAFEEKLDAGLDYRNVRGTNGKYVESVLRTEATYQANERLTSKLLAYYQHLPRTHANYDPLIYTKTMYSLTDYFSDDDEHPINTSVIDDKDPSVGAFGLGAKYALLEELLSVEGVYERTNDPLDFPRGLLNDLSVGTEDRNGQLWDKLLPFLYDQKFFDQPPYDYYNIAKAKLTYTPAKEWEFILGFTFNENKYAAGIDDNINHLGLEVTYMPTDKWTFWLKGIYSRLIDVYKMNQQQRSDFYDSHFNVFFGSQYRLNKDENFTFLYGEFVGYDDPYAQSYWTLSTLDTQHIFRLFYKRKF